MNIGPQLLNGAFFPLLTNDDESSSINILHVTFALSAKAYQDVPNT